VPAAWRSLRPLVAACVLALLPATTAPVSAHPLGNFTVNRYSRVEVTGDGIHIRYVLDLAEIPSVQETPTAQVDWDAYRIRRLEDIRANLALAVDGRPVELQLGDSALTTPVGQANIPLIRIEAWFQTAWAPAAGIPAGWRIHQPAARRHRRAGPEVAPGQD